MTTIIYNKQTGKLTRDGREVGWNTEKGGGGYRHFSLNGKRTPAHRYIWEIHNGTIPKGLMIDHKDRNTLNNKLDNLRLATREQNAQNRRPPSNCLSKYKGVLNSVNKQKNDCREPWRVGIMKDGVTYTKRGFKTEEEAALHYNIKAKEFFGEFAYLNVIKN